MRVSHGHAENELNVALIRMSDAIIRCLFHWTPCGHLDDFMGRFGQTPGHYSDNFNECVRQFHAGYPDNLLRTFRKSHEGIRKPRELIWKTPCGDSENPMGVVRITPWG